MNFGVALALLKVGKRVARDGWNGKGQFVYLVGPGRYPPTTPAGSLIAKDQPDGFVPYRPYLAIKPVDGMVAPWVPSQTDILASDWQLAADEKINLDIFEEVSGELTAQDDAQLEECLEISIRVGGTA